MSIVLNEDEEIGSVNKFREMISEYEIALKKSNENISTLKERICQLMKENSLLKTKLKKAKEDIKEELSEKIELLKQLEKINKNHLFVPTVTSSICQSPCSSCLKVQKENNEIIQSLTNIVTHLLKHNDKDIAKNIIASSLSSSFSITYEDMTKELLSLIDEEQSAMINQFKSEIALRRKIHERYMTLRGKMRVMVRLRPLLSQESSSANKKYLKNTFNIFDNTLSLSLPKKNTKYEFDYIFDHRSEQSDIYDEVKMLIENIFRENNIVIIAYGQTNSGKSYTIDGDSNNEHDGILIRAIKDLFAVRKAHNKKKISISITIIEVYNDIIYNLLINTLYKINDGLNPMVMTNILELKYLDYLGVGFSFNNCCKCGKSSNIITIDPDEGGYICKNCYTNEIIYDSKTLKMLRMYYLVNIESISELKIKDDIIKNINYFVNTYYDRYTGLYLKSKKFLNELINQ